ncbi:MAG TPA: hypothetical protein VME22_10040 [Solirubrobacteraceae bacterium]|nr:hypothetical protein [Solirubrobacteraceae bacterium]HUB71979.1 hypothetical protein [Acidimicrobiales bacterium]
MGIDRDPDGRITGYALYEGDADLATLTPSDRELRPKLAWMADGLDPTDAAARHPVLGRCGVLIERWCERRALFPLAQLLPSYVQGPQGLSGWKSLLAGLERLERVAAGSQLLPADEQEMLSHLLQETKRIVGTGEEG